MDIAKILSAEDERALFGFAPAMGGYFEIVEHTDTLENILFQLVEKPSVWSVK